ncbi:unnamed protein product [Rotaria socialis]|uniref:Uncharacterized protein n=1 Tax=Rotaria socialis TaxID=392032 RepID=A0A817QTH6_9BILA|nr:unnamed protein product [Rotaria socialis]
MAYAPANESDKQTLPILLSPEKQSQYYIVNNHTWSLRFGLICMTSAIVFVTFWSLYQVIQAFILPMNSSYTDGYLFLMVFLTMISLDAYVLFVTIPCGIHFRLFIIAKLAMLLHSVLSYCRDQYYLLMTTISNLLSKLLMKLKSTYHSFVDLNKQNITTV